MFSTTLRGITSYCSCMIVVAKSLLRKQDSMGYDPNKTGPSSAIATNCTCMYGGKAVGYHECEV